MDNKCNELISDVFFVWDEESMGRGAKRENA